MAEAAEDTTEETQETEAAKPEAKEQPKGETPQKPAGKTSADTLYQEKIDTLHGDLSGVRKENKTLKAERDELKAKVAAFELKEKKSTALTEAISGLGEDFEIPSDKMPNLNKLVDKLQDGEDLADSIKSLVDTVKSPKASQRMYEAPWGGNAANQAPGAKTFTPGKTLTPFELASLTPEEAEAYNRCQRY